MIHEDFRREEAIKLGSERLFGQFFAALFALIGLSSVWHGHSSWPAWLAISVTFFIVAQSKPHILYWPNKLWFEFGLLLNKAVQPIVMALLFFIAITPVALLMRLRGADPLRLGFDKDANSYWLVRDRSPNSMSKQF